MECEATTNVRNEGRKTLKCNGRRDFKWTEWLEAIGVCGGENSICHGGKVFLDKLFQTLFSDIKSLK
jgi:hypothetical protein